MIDLLARTEDDSSTDWQRAAARAVAKTVISVCPILALTLSQGRLEAFYSAKSYRKQWEINMIV